MRALWFALLLFARPLVAQSTGDLILGGAYVTAVWVDVAQTREALRRGFTESNPLLGVRPSNTRLHLSAAAAAVAVLVVSSRLPRPWGRALLATSLAVELVMVQHNASLGLGVRF